MLPKSVIGCQFPSFEWSPDFGIRVIMPLLMYSEVSPHASMALKASSSVGASHSHILEIIILGFHIALGPCLWGAR
jgi:hypothetical protein